MIKFDDPKMKDLLRGALMVGIYEFYAQVRQEEVIKKVQ